MHTIVGYCQKCGEPIYTYATCYEITPPHSLYSCMCFANERITEVVMSGSNSENNPNKYKAKW